MKTKYRLKKDLPTIKAGAIFTSEMYNRDGGEDADVDVLEFGEYELRRDAIDNFSEWFEEVKEPRYRKRRIKKIFGEIVVVNYRAIKTLYLPGGEYTYEHEFAYGMNPGQEAEFTVRRNDVDTMISYLNQMVDLGYIEIKDDENIVWEDEDES